MTLSFATPLSATITGGAGPRFVGQNLTAAQRALLDAISLTAGDVPLLCCIGNDAAPHIVVLTSGNALAVRS
jgi:hypothetical protein